MVILKTVRFCDQNETYLDSRSPSPVSTSTSRNSSPYTVSDFAITPPSSPAGSNSPLVVNVDSYSGGNSFYHSGLHQALRAPTGILFDLNLSPDHPFNDIWNRVDISVLEAPAIHTYPMKVQCSFLPWTIEISPQGGMPFITVQHVLLELYHALHAVATKAEIDNEDVDKRASIIQEWSYRAQEDQRIRRIDWLPIDERRFRGLDGGDITNVWRLYLDR